ncbi:MAG: hypothetical protein U0903_07020, partial [Planctomycetales bacterium]
YPSPGPVPSDPSVPTTPTQPTDPNGPVAGPTPPPNTNPVPNPTDPVSDPGVAGAPWPLPPINGGAQINTVSANNIQLTAGTAEAKPKYGRPNRSLVAKDSKAAKRQMAAAGLPGQEPSRDQIADGINPTPSEDLKYRGGKTLPHLSYVNLYVSGDTAWKQEDMQNIEHAIAAAMTDQHLNNVIMQYFNNQPISTNPLPSHPLVGYKPGTVSQGDVHYYLAYLYQQGYLKNYDLNTTIFNFLLPPGTVLNDESARTGKASTDSPAEVSKKTEEKEGEDGEGLSAVPKADEGDSAHGLGGYHGSIHVGNVTLYYSVNVFSERRADGKTNGIPVFSDSWKNVVATLYHEMQEARTDPDVEDAINNASSPNAERLLGWTSDRGEEIGDFPLEEADQLQKIIREVPLANGSGTVPIQLQYSNAVHGPEGPIPAPHPLQ